jgi:hypothetical protein
LAAGAGAQLTITKTMGINTNKPIIFLNAVIFFLRNERPAHKKNLF